MSYIALRSNLNKVLLKVMQSSTFNKTLFLNSFGSQITLIVVYSNAIVILGLQDLYKLTQVATYGNKKKMLLQRTKAE
jgi:hypothetical protein